MTDAYLLYHGDFAGTLVCRDFAMLMDYLDRAGILLREVQFPLNGDPIYSSCPIYYRQDYDKLKKCGAVEAESIIPIMREWHAETYERI